MARKSEFWKQQKSERRIGWIRWMGGYFIIAIALGLILYFAVFVNFRKVPIITKPYTASLAGEISENDCVNIKSVVYGNVDQSKRYSYSVEQAINVTEDTDPEALTALLADAPTSKRPHAVSNSIFDMTWEIHLTQNGREILISLGKEDYWTQPDAKGNVQCYRIQNGDELEAALNAMYAPYITNK